LRAANGNQNHCHDGACADILAFSTGLLFCAAGQVNHSYPAQHYATRRWARRHMSTTPRYIAALSNVSEVSLVGTADLAFWKAHLRDAGSLTPAESEGKARLLVSSSAAKFMGVPLAEFSVCVLVVPPVDCGWKDAAYLVHAFNSRRFFALVERVLYSTPYYHGRIDVTAAFPPSVQVRADDGGTYRAALRVGAGKSPPEPSRSGAECWNGPVFLPGRRGGRGTASRVFFAKLQGLTRAFPYAPSRDTVEITPASAGSVFQMLIDSGFQGREWIVREGATHAKSRTYPAPQAIASYRPDAA
jgi:hypothetical protein